MHTVCVTKTRDVHVYLSVRWFVWSYIKQRKRARGDLEQENYILVEREEEQKDKKEEDKEEEEE